MNKIWYYQLKLNFKILPKLILVFCECCVAGIKARGTDGEDRGEPFAGEAARLSYHGPHGVVIRKELHPFHPSKHVFIKGDLHMPVIN